LENLLPRDGANKTLKYCVSTEKGLTVDTPFWVNKNSDEKFFQALVLTVLCGAAVYVIKPRNQAPSQTQEKHGTFRAAFGDVAALKNLNFWIFLLSNTLQALASFLPALYLPSK
jgi:hypothetical protein